MKYSTYDTESICHCISKMWNMLLTHLTLEIVYIKHALYWQGETVETGPVQDASLQEQVCE